MLFRSVNGMRHFSRTTGCRLIAEGIETPEEAATLVALGVEYGQGFLYGRPAPAAAWEGRPVTPPDLGLRGKGTAIAGRRRRLRRRPPEGSGPS